MSKLKIIPAKPIIFPVTVLVQLLVLFSPVGASAASLPSNLLPGAASLSPLASASTDINNDFNILTTAQTGEDVDTDETSDSESGQPLVVDSDLLQIAIRAINPGYTTEAGKNSGELIELVNLTGEEVALDNIALVYTAKPTAANKFGKSTVLYYFEEGSKFLGESILLRYAGAPETKEGNQDLIYDNSLAMAGGLTLMKVEKAEDLAAISQETALSSYGEIINSVCWWGGDDCLPVFSTTVKSRSYTTIVRDPDTEEYTHVASYVPVYNSATINLYLPPSKEEASETDNGAGATSTVGAQCKGLHFSEILTYYESEQKEQFIEFYNPTDETIQLQGCQVKYKNKLYQLTSETDGVAAGNYYVMRPSFSLTKNPNSENVLELVDVNNAVVATLSYPHGQKKAASYAFFGYDNTGKENWQITYAQTPGAANVFQEYKSCPAGKVINEATGNCVKATAVSSTLADCPAGKYRNPATGRCKAISSSDSGTSECKEGYERNPETNRCRKVKNNDGADYPVVPTTGIEEQSTFIALWALGGIALIGAGYAVFQFRKEIAYALRKFATKLKRK